MSETRFWLIRHAIVDENARAILYGIMDVPLCETSWRRAPVASTRQAILPTPAKLPCFFAGSIRAAAPAAPRVAAKAP